MMSEFKQLPVCLDRVKEVYNSDSAHRQKIMFESSDFAIGPSVLFREAGELISVCLMIPSLGEPSDINHFKQKVAGMIVTFQQRIDERYRRGDAQNLALFLCCLFDELVMHSQWRNIILWSNQTLSSTLFKRRDSGHYLLGVIKNWVEHPNKNRDALLFSYFALYIGFQGEWRFKEPQMRRVMISLLDEKVRLKKYSDEYRFDSIKPVLSKKMHMIHMKKMMLYALFCTLTINLSGFLWALSYQSTSIDALMEVRVEKDQSNPPYTPASPKEAVEVLFSSSVSAVSGQWQ